ncbi:unnamed protein product [Blepharisma stoltei]|uniref:Uncharacterized protein n=1 Tax=Blepharisma stoltei TaxID=1481888 RepID=A0AAU9JA06_9CILI|nr:unnamed protein product [Blepharisma stoltei]
MKRPINILTFTQKEEPLSLSEITPIASISKELDLQSPYTEIEQADFQALTFEERKKYSEAAMIWLRSLFSKRKLLKSHPSTILDQTNQFANTLCNWIVYSLRRDKRTQAFGLIGVLDKLIDPKSKLKFKDRNALRARLQIYNCAYYLKEKKNVQAIEACEKAIELTEKINASQDLVLALSICGYTCCVCEDHKRALDMHQRALELLSNKFRVESDKVNVFIAVCLYNSAIECVHMNVMEEAQNYVAQAYNVAQAHLKGLPLVHTKVLWLYKELKDTQKSDVLPKIDKQPSFLGASDSKVSKALKDTIKSSPSKSQVPAPHSLFKIIRSSAQDIKISRPSTSGTGEKRIGRDLLISEVKKPRPISANKHDLIDIEKSPPIGVNDKPQILSLKEKIRIRSKKEKTRTRIESVKKIVTESDFIVKARIQAARKIQRKWREFYKSRNLKIIKIQKWYKGLKCVKKIKQIKNSIIMIQAVVRRREAYIRMQELAAGHLENKHQAVAKIQKCYRGRRNYRQYKQLKNAVLLLQAIFKRKDAIMKVQEMRENYYNDKNLKILNIQRCYRGHKGRQNYRELRNSIIMIQAFFRRNQAWQTIQELKKEICKYDDQKVLKIQTHYRGYKERKNVKALKDFILLLQSAFRRKEAIIKVMNMKNEHYSSHNENVIKIQKSYRGCIARKNYKKLTNSIVAIQSLLKRKEAYNIVKAMKQKIVLAQSCIKTGLAKMKYQKATAGIIKIQSNWRRFMAIKAVSLKENSINKVKAFLLGILTRKRMIKKNYSATKIQSWYKSLLVQRAMNLPQRHVKKFILKLIIGICKELKNDAKEISIIKHKEKEIAAIRIQSLWRKCMGKARKELVQKSMGRIKGFLLGIITRKRLQKRMNSAVKIQSWIKGVLCRKNGQRFKIPMKSS